MADLHLGRTVAGDGATAQDVTVATDDLVTHGVIVGMTGSGKTGLGVVLIEECLAAGVPALLIDPKGDLTNLALVFPGLSAPEFQPWVDPAQAKSAGRSTAEFAAEQAQLWRQGLGGWGIDEASLAEFAAAFDVTIYTPGSNAGVPLNVLGSLRAPESRDPEVIADEIEGYVTSLLSVVGIAADPLSSREHILLSNIISAAWSSGESLDLGVLLARVQQPPMRKLGVFDLDQFFPPTERTAFALRLNAVLAAPTFQTWISGEDIDIASMLRTPDGRPRCAVITTAHLSDEDRQNATSIVLAKVITWMRRQSGTTDLRALLYMDEVAGYLPPTANPATKKPIMLLMKQARAFGLGVVLSTQNPVDIDYKALSNAGTWMIGRLTTERDKSRLLEGMSSAAGGFDPGEVGEGISGLGKRQFLLRKAGRNDVQVFGTKWARSYLRGPMTRDQIAAVMAQKGSSAGGSAQSGSPASAPVESAPVESAPVASVPVANPPVEGHDETPLMPTVHQGVTAWHVDPAAEWVQRFGGVLPGAAGVRLEAAAAARVHVRYDEAKADLVHDEEYEAIIHPLPQGIAALNAVVVDFDDRDFVQTPPAGARYAIAPVKLDTATFWRTLQRDLVDHLVRNRAMRILTNPQLKLYARVGESAEEFNRRCIAAAEAAADADTAALESKYRGKLSTLEGRLGEAVIRAQAADAAVGGGAVMASVGSVLTGYLAGRRSSSAIASAARRHQTATAKAAAAAGKVNAVHAQIAQIEAELTDEVAVIHDRWRAKASAVEPLTVPIEKTDVKVLDLRLVWLPVA